METPISPPITPTQSEEQLSSRDPEEVILLTVIRCIGLLYGYYQVRLLCNLGSKYTLAITSIFPLFGSLIFTSLGFLLPHEFKEIPETLLYFLLIMDLPRACFLTSIALQNQECCKIGACSSSIFQGVKILAPWLTMDTVIECIVLILGYCSGIRRLEALCTFVCLSVLINYIVLLAIFPLALRLIHEVIGSNKESDVGSNYLRKVNSSVQSSVKYKNNKRSSGASSKLDQLLWNWGEASEKMNKAMYQRTTIKTSYANEANLPTEVCLLIQPSSFWLRGKILAAVILALAYVFGWISISVDQLVVLSVAAALTIRYLFFEEKSDSFKTVSEESTVTTTTTTVNTVYLNSGIAGTSSSVSASTQAVQNTSGASSNASAIHSANNNCNSVPAAITQIIPTATAIAPIGSVPASKRVRKMPVNVNEVEVLLNQNNLLESKNNGKDVRELCSSPDSGICGKSSSATASGAVTPITFSIGDHSESDDEGEDTGLSMKMKRSGTKTDLENKLENLKLEREEEEAAGRWTGPPRSLDECLSLYQSDEGVKQLSDEEVINLVNAKYIQAYQLEKAVQDLERGVAIRRKLSCMQKDVTGTPQEIPYKHYDYTLVQGACCENVIGYIPIPVGIAGPLKMDDKLYYIPMATTEGCLVASTNRGCRAFMQTGVRARVVNEGMSRAPVVRFPDTTRAAEAMIWLGEPENFAEIKQNFDASSRFARLVKIHPRIAGRYLFIRFVAKTGDAMGMNMISKGTEVALTAMQNIFPDMEVLALSGNVCTDKKPAAINWLEGRGKSVVAEAVIPANIVETTLKTTTAALVELNIAKNLIGSAAAGSIGGFNAHAANIVTAVYIACGQDPAQNVCSSNCMTIMEPYGADGRDLFISVTMPSIECGTIGGGTILPPQAACLEMMGVKGANRGNPGENARTFARLVSAAVLAGELSLMSALAAGHLVKSHLKHNRSATLLSALETENGSSTPVSRVNSSLGAKNTSLFLSPTSPTRLTPERTMPNKPENMKNSRNNSKSSPQVIETVDFLSMPDCKQT